MLAWQCRMACSMLDDFFALGYQVDMTLFEIFTFCWNTYIHRIVHECMRSIKPNTRHLLVLQSTIPKGTENFCLILCEINFFRTSFRILSRVEVIYDFRFIKELEFYFKGNVSNKMVVQYQGFCFELNVLPVLKNFAFMEELLRIDQTWIHLERSFEILILKDLNKCIVT